jgi:soluble lytic murein transglycosylase-like protein
MKGKLTRIALIVTLFFSAPAGAHEDPFTYASRLTGVPRKLLVAISWVKSSHKPFALNISGASVYPRNYQHAWKILRQTNSRVDIGLMQISYAVWGRRLRLSKEALLNPYTNVLAGAAILKRLLKRYPLWEAVGRYNSARRDRQVRYAWKVYRALKRQRANKRGLSGG